MSGPHTELGAECARRTRAELGIDPVAPIPCTLTLTEELLGIPVNVTALPDEVEGLCWRLGDQVILWVGAATFTPRRRFTLAHELGHVRCGHDERTILETYRTLAGKVTTSIETQANAFAAELLAPGAGIAELLGGATPTIDHAVEVATCFGLSPRAAIYRFVSLGLLPGAEPLLAAYDGDRLPQWDAREERPEPDALCRLTRAELPRLSPLLGDSALAGLLRGEASVDEVATATGADRYDLVAGLALVGL